MICSGMRRFIRKVKQIIFWLMATHQHPKSALSHIIAFVQILSIHVIKRIHNIQQQYLMKIHYSDVIFKRDGVPDLDYILNRLFRRRTKKASKLRVTGLCEGNSSVTCEFPAQRASNAKSVYLWWRHHDIGNRMSGEYKLFAIGSTSKSRRLVFIFLQDWQIIRSSAH